MIAPGAEGPAVLLGARGWEHAGWRERFYPAGMPEDWWLTFYNTQFGCVFLDETTWQGAGDETLGRWREETHERFLFLLEGDAAAPAPDVLAGKAVVLRADDPAILWFERDTDLKQISAWLQRQDASPGVRFVLSRDADLGQIERVTTLLELLGW